MTDEGDVVRGDRFTGGPARDFISSLPADRRIFEADLAVDRAHVVMLAERGIIPEETAGRILDGLASVEAAGFDALAGEDVHAAIETAVIEAVGPEGGRMHTARSRNDEVATCLRYRLREDLLGVIESTVALRTALASVTAAELTTVMPGYTHMQPAQPTTVAHWALSYESALARDTERLLSAVGRTNRSPLGACALAGTSFPIDRERTASLLGFEGVVENAMDAVSTRDFMLETTAALLGTATSAGGLSEDVIYFATRGFVDLDDRYASTSSIMPQKKNPDPLELVRATAGDALAGVVGVASTLKGLPRSYNRDLQRTTPHVWDTIDTVDQALGVAAGAVQTATWDEELLEVAASEGFTTATDIADLLVQAGVPFRSAHRTVAAATTDIEDPTDVAAVYEALREAAREHLEGDLPGDVDRATVATVLDPTARVEARDSPGGPAPSVVEDMLTDTRDRLASDRATLSDHRDRLQAAAAERAAAVEAFR